MVITILLKQATLKIPNKCKGCGITFIIPSIKEYNASFVANNVATVGAPTEDVAFLFKKEDDTGEWNQVARITLKDDNGVHVKGKINFGFSVAVSGDVVVIGAPYNREGMVGSAYIFDAVRKEPGREKQGFVLWIPN